MDEPKSPPANRRACRRQRPKRTTKLVCRMGRTGMGPNLAHAMLDVSESGARILATAPLAVGSVVEVSLEALWLRQPLRREAEVVWCVATADGRHAAGLQFEKLLSYAEFQSLAYI
jgi:hypothetical protein